MRPSQRYRNDEQLLAAFRTAFLDLYESADHVHDPVYRDFITPKVDSDTWSAKRRAVATAAGAATAAFGRFGAQMAVQGPTQVLRFDPVANWHQAIDDPGLVPPENLLASADAAIAAAKQAATEAEEREKGLTGKVAAFVRWPNELREAVGPDQGGEGKAVKVVGRAAQILVLVIVTAVGGALAVGLVALSVWLWHLVF